MLLVVSLRHNPAGTRASLKKFQALLALRPRLRPRHYRALRCSDADARTKQPLRQALPVTPVALVCVKQTSAHAG